MKSSSTLCRGAFRFLIVLSLAALAGPAVADHDREEVTLYEDVHFRGHSETFHGDVSSLRGSYLGNDSASSIAVPRGCRVTLYRDAGFRGPSTTLRHDIADLRATRVGNDEISSLSLDCYGGRYDGSRYDGGRYRDDRTGGDRERRHRGVTVFSNAEFRGRRESFRYDDPDLRDNPIRQDTISSVHVAPGCRAVLFADVGFRGNATVVTDGIHNLGFSAVGNDRVSSIQVDCERYR